MTVSDLALALGALRATLTDYGIDPKTQEDITSRFARVLVEEEIAAARDCITHAPREAVFTH